MDSIVKRIIFVVVIVVAFTALFNVRIKNIKIVGNDKVSDSVIASQLFENEIDRISAVFFFKNKFKKRKNISRINSYEIEWQSPVSVVVHVKENKAVAFVRRDLYNLYFDRDGIINEVSTEKKDNATEVTGVDFRNYEEGEKIEMSNKKLFNAILNISDFLSESDLKVSLLEVKKDDSIYLYIDNIIVNMGDLKNIEVKLQRLVDIYPEIKDLSGTLDLSTAKENMLDEQYIFKKG